MKDQLTISGKWLVVLPSKAVEHTPCNPHVVGLTPGPSFFFAFNATAWPSLMAKQTSSVLTVVTIDATLIWRTPDIGERPSKTTSCCELNPEMKPTCQGTEMPFWLEISVFASKPKMDKKEARVGSYFWKKWPKLRVIKLVRYCTAPKVTCFSWCDVICPDTFRGTQFQLGARSSNLYGPVMGQLWWVEGRWCRSVTGLFVFGL